MYYGTGYRFYEAHAPLPLVCDCGKHSYYIHHFGSSHDCPRCGRPLLYKSRRSLMPGY